MMSGMALRRRFPDRRGAGTRPASRGAAAVVLVLLATAGCTDSGDPEEPDPPGSVALQLETVSGADGLDRATLTEVEDEVGDVLSQYVADGFLGTYPRGDFVRAYDSFSEGLVPEAARDLDILTAAGFADAEAVRATELHARLSLLSPDGDVIGASAAVRLAFEATLPGGETRPIVMRGRLLLEKQDGEWSFFGYDVRRRGDAAVAGEVS